jgi:molecular chaperone DnaK (HSP70)
MENVVGFPLIKMLKEKDPSSYLDLIRKFEGMKRKIDIGSTGKVNMSIPYSTINSLCQDVKCQPLETIIKKSSYSDQITIRGDKIRIDADLMKSVFYATIEKITVLVQEMFSEIYPLQVPFILLVGGLAECKMIHASLKQAFPTKKIIVPQEPGISVLKGAVLFGHVPDFIACRVMRYSYGTDSYVDFDTDEYVTWRKEILEGKTVCKIFQQIIGQNTPALIDTKIEHDYKTIDSYQRYMTINIFACEKEYPKYVDEVGCTKIGQVEVNIPSPSVDQRNVAVNYIFGKTEISIMAEELKTGSKYNAKIKLI